jgi:hypothetical protein
MKRLACSCLALALAACAPPTPPAQVVEALPIVPDAPSTSPTAVAADIGASLDPAPPPPPTEPFQQVSGTLNGAAWQLKGAATTGPVSKDGWVTITLANYLLDCGAHEQAPDDRAITLLIPWKARAKLDLATLKAAEATATFIDEKKKKLTPIKGFKPKGSVEVVGAPTGMKSSGRIKIDLTSGKDGKDAITAEIPVRVCFAL